MAKRRGWAVKVQAYSYSRGGKIVKVDHYARKKPSKRQ